MVRHMSKDDEKHGLADISPEADAERMRRHLELFEEPARPESAPSNIIPFPKNAPSD